MKIIIKFTEKEKGQDLRTWYSLAYDIEESKELIRMNTENYIVSSNFRGITTKYMEYHNNENIKTIYEIIDISCLPLLKTKDFDLASQLKLSTPMNIKKAYNKYIKQ